MLLNSNIAAFNGVGLRERMSGVHSNPFQATTGQTLTGDIIEWFPADVTSSAKSNFDVVAGTCYGGLQGGPNAASHLTRSSGGLPRITAADIAANTTMFTGNRYFGTTTIKMFGCWVRFNPAIGPITTRQPFMTACDSAGTFFGWDHYFGIYVLLGTGGNAGMMELTQGYELGNQQSTAVAVPFNTWVWIQTAFTKTANGSNFDFDFTSHYKVLGGTLTQIATATKTGVGTTASWTTTGVQITQILDAVKVGYSGGRVSALCMFDCDTYANAKLYPGVIGAPIEQAHTYEINQTGSDAVNNGPWASADAIMDVGWRKSVLLGSRYPWGVGNSYSDLTTANLKRAFGDAYVAGNRSPAGDVVSIIAKTDRNKYFITKTLDLTDIAGVDVVGTAVDGSYPVISVNEAFSGSWTQTVPGVSAWFLTTTGLDNAGIWRREVGTGELIYMHPVRIENKTNALVELLLRNHSCWTDGTDVYVNYNNNSNPSSETWERLNDAIPADGAGNRIAFTLQNGRIKNIIVEGGLEWVENDTTPIVANYQFNTPWNATAGFIAVMDNCTGRRFSKHSFSTAAPSGAYGLVIHANCITLGGPANSVNADTGIPAGSWTPHVDYSDTVSNGEAVSLWYNNTDTGGNTCIAGSASYTDDPTVTSYYAHVGSGSNQLALVLHKGNTWYNATDANASGLAAVYTLEA